MDGHYILISSSRTGNRSSIDRPFAVLNIGANDDPRADGVHEEAGEEPGVHEERDGERETNEALAGNEEPRANEAPREK